MKHARRLLVTVALVLAGCSDSTSGVETGSAAASAERDTLDAVLEHLNTQITDPGSGWVETGRWWTEGSLTDWTTPCEAFNRLGDMFNAGTPETVVWDRDGDALFQRTDDFGWDAVAFARDIEVIPDRCSDVQIGSLTVAVEPVDRAVLGDVVDRITDGDPQGVVVAIRFDAYPVPSLETDISTPEFEPGRGAWMVIATRHNVVSQIVFSPRDGFDGAQLRDLVERQIAALVDADPETTGPIVRPAGPIEVDPGWVADAELFVDPVDCRNGGHLELDGVRWLLAEPVPFEWRGITPILGDFDFGGTSGDFTAYPGPPAVPGEEGEEAVDVDEADDEDAMERDGFTVSLTTGFVDTECDTWEQEPPTERPTSIGPLDCDDRGIVEVRFAEDGVDPSALATEHVPDAVEAVASDPLMWNAVDATGDVVGVLFLGDDAEPDWQIFTCG